MLGRRLWALLPCRLRAPSTAARPGEERAAGAVAVTAAPAAAAGVDVDVPAAAGEDAASASVAGAVAAPWGWWEWLCPAAVGFAAGMVEGEEEAVRACAISWGAVGREGRGGGSGDIDTGRYYTGLRQSIRAPHLDDPEMMLKSSSHEKLGCR